MTSATGPIAPLSIAVPEAWRAPAALAVRDLSRFLGVAEDEIAVGLAEESTWTEPASEAGAGAAGRPIAGLEIWLVSGARTYRYAVRLPDGPPERKFSR